MMLMMLRKICSQSLSQVFGLTNLFLLTLVAPVHAATITFDLTGAATIIPADQPLVLSSGGVDLFASGWTVDATGGSPAANAPFTSVSPRGINQTVNGLGVFNGVFSGDSTQTDGVGLGELLRIQFSTPVQLENIVFGLVGTNDEFDFGIGPDLNPANVSDVRVNQTYGNDRIGALAAPLGPATTALLDFDFTVGPIVFVGSAPGTSIAPAGQTFEFYLSDENDDYKIVALSVSVIPEPTTLGLTMLATCCGLIVTARRGATT